ncbi:MAG: hypothetical protein JSV94_06870, partial [Methanobacteriota archaeon]
TSTTFVFDASDSSDDRDPLSDLTVRWDWTDDGAWDTTWSSLKTASHQYSITGPKTVRMEVRDTSGLANNTTTQIVVDGAAPITSYKLSGTIGDGGWYRSDVTVVLEAEDDLSGVTSTFYRIDSGDWHTYSEAVIISDNGEHDLEFYSVDEAGNNETIESLPINLDGIAGSLKAVYPTDGSIVRNGTPTIVLYFDDSMASSGIHADSVSLAIDSQPLTGTHSISQDYIFINLTVPLDDGWHQLSAYAEDLGGNAAVLGIGFIVNTSELNGDASDLQEQLESLAEAVAEITETLNYTLSSLNSLAELVSQMTETMQNLSDSDDDSIYQLRDSLNETQSSLDDLNEQLENTEERLSSDLSSTNSLLIALFGLIAVIAVISLAFAIVMRRDLLTRRSPPNGNEPPPPTE